MSESFIKIIENTKDEELEYLRKGNNWKSVEVFLEKLWDSYKNYANKKTFLGDCCDVNFHPRFWEMYLACTLLENGFELVPKKEKGPDLCIKNPKIWIEATVSTDGLLNENKDSNYPMKKIANFAPMKSGFFTINHEKNIIRYISSVKEKIKKHESYIDNNILDLHEPYLIALNGYKTELSIFNDQFIDGLLPPIFKAVFPIGNGVFNYEYGHMYEYRPNITKSNGTQIPTDTFLNHNHSNISGILYSRVGLQLIYSWIPKKLSSDFIFIHNPNALKKMPPGWLKVGHEYWFEDDLLIKFDHEKQIREEIFKVLIQNGTWNLVDLKF